ncbi:hypothetical protein [Falsiroseomonas oryzae]|uniref:hypothetical protein n=1 Tax=Falsiroseomonas oryzae TaxID=2766473 RepID=UPI0022EB8A58|nr:hypothetical protein [Roseomonas sp. MO-31]
MIRDAATSATVVAVGQPPTSQTRATQPARDEGPPASAAADPTQVVTNPSLRLDAALNLVVIEFRDSAGEVMASIPSPRELSAYRVSGPTPEADTPARLDVTR